MIKRICGAILSVALMIGFFVFFAVDVSAASEMKASENCIKMIQDTEGFRAIPYWDYSQWTVGFGSACPAEDLERYKKEGIPVDEANALFASQLSKFEKAVNKFIDKHGLTLSQQQFDALVSFSYNLGSGILSSTSNTIVQAILNGATENEIVFAFSIYCMAGGEFLSGLMRRRLAEANMYLNGEYDEYPPDNFCYVRYDANGGVRDGCAQGYDANLAAVPLSRPTYSGYTFVGWYTQPEGGVKIISLDETTAGMTLYAHWEKGETSVDTPTDPTTGINVSVVGSVVHVRSGPGMNYGIVTDVYAGKILTITGTTEADGQLWGLCSEGWVPLNHTTYFDIVSPDKEEDKQEEQLQLPAYATVINADGITVYNGPHTTYPQLKTLPEGSVVLLEEVIVFAGSKWARYEGGWIRLNSKVLVHDDSVLAHSFTVKTTASGVAVRSGPGTSYSKETTLSKGTSHKVYAIKVVNGTAWGRIAKGWISLAYTNYDSSKLEQYRNHSFGQWYNTVASTCVTPGVDRQDCQYCDHYQTREAELGDHSLESWFVVTEATCTEDGLEQRNCQHCDHYETRAIAAAGHSFGDWYETKAATAEEAGEERRDCQHCAHYETRVIEPSDHTFGEWYVTEDATCTEPGQERRDCQNCQDGEHYEVRELEATGHSYGDWYESIAPTTTEYGQERRDCQHCDHYETRQTDKLPAPSVTRTYATIICDVLRIRSGPGTSYSQVGKLDRGAVVEILEMKEVGSSAWGRIEMGWICLTGYVELSYVEETHTTHTYGEWYETKAPTTTEYGEERRDCTECDHYETRQVEKLQIETVEKVYATLYCDYLNVRTGAGTSYSRIAKLYKGVRVEILERVTKSGVVWGRTSIGWICLTGYAKLETVTEEVKDVESVTMTVAVNSLTIRSGAGTSYSVRGYLYTGAKIQVLETATVNGAVWVRTEIGWLMAKYLK